MSFEDPERAYRNSAGWIGIGFRIGVGFFLAMIVCVSVSLAIWMGILRLTSRISFDSAAEDISHTLESLPHPSIPKQAPPRGFKVDPHDRQMCLKLSNGEVNQQFIECMQENAATPSAP